MSDAKNDAVAVLVTAYQAMQDEYDRIDNLLEPNDKNPLGKYASIINSRFTDPISAASINLDRIKTNLEKLERPPEEETPEEIPKEPEGADATLPEPESPEGILNQCWSDYFELKTKLMPILSTELLAVIGGIYLREKQLDDTRVRRSGSFSGGPEPISFSDTAELLVRDLAIRSGKGWESVLIVGEERLAHSETEIIRLRFPACDIWNLPFTAHEYGYLVARKKAPDKFRILRDKVRHDVRPENHKVGSPPEEWECFLPEVQQIWHRYHDQLHSEDDRKEFVAENERLLTSIADAQESHLCRLYADAFATFFIGPAYVLALLYLRFVPDNMSHLLLTGMPPFAHRFVFALETLKWMNAEPVIDAEHNRGSFENEVFEQEGIPALWRATLDSLKHPDPYPQIVKQYQSWLGKIKDSLKAHFAAPNAIGTTYKNWRAVDEIKKQLLVQDPKLSARPEMWSVLSGAWIARWENRDRLMQIHDAALQFLSGSPTVVKQSEKEAPGGAASKQKGSITPAQAIAEVKKALGADYKASKSFREMIKSGRFQEKPEILTALIDEDSAFEMYSWLLENQPVVGADGDA